MEKRRERIHEKKEAMRRGEALMKLKIQKEPKNYL